MVYHPSKYLSCFPVWIHWFDLRNVWYLTCAVLILRDPPHLTTQIAFASPEAGGPSYGTNPSPQTTLWWVLHLFFFRTVGIYSLVQHMSDMIRSHCGVGGNVSSAFPVEEVELTKLVYGQGEEITVSDSRRLNLLELLWSLSAWTGSSLTWCNTGMTRQRN